MTRILVTGASGRLGRLLVPRLMAGGHEVRAMSRTRRASASGEQWVVANVDRRDTALDETTKGVEAVIHCASNQPTAATTDIGGTSNLLAAAKNAGVRHFIYVSIVGIDGAEQPYYGAKVAAELAVMGSTLPWTILRTTQFHELLGEWLTMAAEGGPMLLAEGVRFRPVATS
ncbi:MAG: NAD(P)H-binding protein, partial [Dehalococcoidia bacterium]|nr:NAD(P)H-binding protein [Dehalococcoidia bacterium]